MNHLADADYWKARAKQEIARIEALEAALREIGSFPYVGEKAAQQMALIANAAIERKDKTF